MRDENIFWIKFWRVASLTAVVLMTLLASCTSLEDYHITKLVKSGADPIEAACAIRPRESKQQCLLRSVK